VAAERPFRFGVVSGRAESGQAWIETARRVEAMGYSTLLVPDTLAQTLSPFPALGVAAAATSRLRLSPFVLANDLRNPVLVARESATLDFLSGGRFELGLGAGRPGAEDDNRKLGIPFDSGGARVARLAEAIRMLKALLAGETVDAPGPHYAARGADVWPPPVQRPRPPIMVAAAGPRLLALAAREVDIVALGAVPQEGEAGVRDRIETIRRAAGARFDELELSMNLFAVGGRVHPLVARWGGSGEEVLRSGSPAVLLGAPDEMAEQLRRSRDVLGITYITVWDDFAEALAPVVERLAGR
jgi:probable F420-dependent oxidoreductase